MFISTFTLTNNELANTCLLHEHMLKGLEKSSKQIVELKKQIKQSGGVSKIQSKAVFL